MFRVFAAALLALLPLTLAAGAADNAGADRVEEDWEVVIAAPDPDVTCPQITTSMRVDASDSSPVTVFNLNYRDAPAFRAGGVQVKLRTGDQTLAASSKGSAQFQTRDESVTWKQRLTLTAGELKFKVADGKSTTWGDFGVDDDELSVSTTSALTSLAGYDPATSVRESGPSFGSNRVARMTLLRVRYYQGQTLLSTDEAPRPVNLAN